MEEDCGVEPPTPTPENDCCEQSFQGVVEKGAVGTVSVKACPRHFTDLSLNFKKLTVSLLSEAKLYQSDVDERCTAKILRTGGGL